MSEDRASSGAAADGAAEEPVSPGRPLSLLSPQLIVLLLTALAAVILAWRGLAGLEAADGELPSRERRQVVLALLFKRFNPAMKLHASLQDLNITRNAQVLFCTSIRVCKVFSKEFARFAFFGMI